MGLNRDNVSDRVTDFLDQLFMRDIKRVVTDDAEPGGTSIEVILRDPGLVSRMGGGEMPTTRAEKAIQAVRKMVRESKGATA